MSKMKNDNKQKQLTRRNFLKKVGVTLGTAAFAGNFLSGKILYAQEPLKLGVIYPLTGPLAELGHETFRGNELAKKVRNKAGGINGREIEFLEKDALDADAAVSQVEALAGKVPVIVGTYSSTLSFAATARAYALGIPYWEMIGTANKITERELSNIFSTNPVATHFGAAAGDVVKGAVAPALGKKPEELRVALLHEDGLFGTDVASGAGTKFIKYGMDMVANEAYDKEATDLTSTILRLKKVEPDVIYHVAYLHDAILFWKQLKSLGYTPPVVVGGGAGYSMTDFVPEALGDDGLGILNCGLTTYNTNPEWAPGITDYITLYNSEYGRPPRSGHSVTSYFGIKVLFDVLEKVLAKGKSITVETIEEVALKIDRPRGTSPAGYGVKFHPTKHRNLRAWNPGSQYQRDTRTDDLWFPERADGTPTAYTVYPEEAKLPGVEVERVPLPKWEER